MSPQRRVWPPPTKQEPPNLGREAALGTAVSDKYATPSPDAAQRGKWLALLLYNIGAQSLDATQAAFDRHPEWVSA